MSVQVGDIAPDFELKDQTGQPVRLSDYRGKKNVVLVFYPQSFTGLCEEEMCSIRDALEVFQNDEVQTLGISVDPPPTQRQWAHQQGFDFPLLSDFWPHGEVASRFGLFDDTVGLALRGTVIIDRDGRVTYADRSPLPEARDPEAWKAALRRVGAPA